MTDEMKNLLKNAKSAEEAKAIIDNNRESLTDEELASIAGGNKNAYSGMIGDINCF